MGLALFMEATGALSMEWRWRAPSRLGLRSPGKKVNSESLCAPGNLPEKKRERERKSDTGRPSLGETGLQLYFQKWLLYPELHISRSERYKEIQSQLNIPSVLPLSKPGHFLHGSESEVSQSCPNLCNPIDCSLAGSSDHGIFQAIILEWIAISFSRGVFLTQGLNPRLTHCRQTLYRWNQDIFCITFQKQRSYVMYVIFWPFGLLTFCNTFLINVGQQENLLSLYLSSLHSPSGKRAVFLWSKGAVGYNKERTY